MKFYLTYTPSAEKDLTALPKAIARRIVDKMDWFVAQQDPLSFAKKLQALGKPLYRFRIGDYRVIFRIDHGILTLLVVLAVRDRKESYRQI